MKTRFAQIKTEFQMELTTSAEIVKQALIDMNWSSMRDNFYESDMIETLEKKFI
jgi:hypothetical protein